MKIREKLSCGRSRREETYVGGWKSSPIQREASLLEEFLDLRCGLACARVLTSGYAKGMEDAVGVDIGTVPYFPGDSCLLKDRGSFSSGENLNIARLEFQALKR